MGKVCSICSMTSEKRKVIEKKVTLGQMDLGSAATELGVNAKMLWHHLKNHLGDTIDTPKEVEAQVRSLLTMLTELVEGLLGLPAETYQKQLPSMIREVRELIKLLGQIKGEIPTQQNNQVYLVQINHWLLQNLDPKTKLAFADFLDKIDSIEPAEVTGNTEVVDIGPNV